VSGLKQKSVAYLIVILSLTLAMRDIEYPLIFNPIRDDIFHT
jgi:hypothetical protein